MRPLLFYKFAAHADFFSFGTNDLTQTTFGLSRDDSGRFLPNYIERRILPEDPFQMFDREGVGQLSAVSVIDGAFLLLELPSASLL